MNNKLMKALLGGVLVWLALSPVAMAAGGPSNDPWGDLLFKAGNLLALAVLIWWFARKGIANFFRGAATAEKDRVSSTRERNETAAHQLAEQKRKIEGLQAELAAMSTAAKADAEKEKAEMIADAERQAQRITSQVGQQVSQAVEHARQSLRKEMAGQLIEQAEGQIKSKMSSQQQTKLVTEYLGELEA